MGQYQEVFERSVSDPETFWAEAAEQIDWIVPIAGKVFFVRSNDPIGCTKKAFALGIVTRPANEGLDGRFGFVTCWSRGLR